MKLIPDWRRAWRFLSVQCSSIGAALATAYAALYDKLRDTFPPRVMMAITGLVFVLAIIGRLVHQPEKDEPK